MSWKNYTELIWYRALADLRAEAARAYLGFIWWFLEPVFYMAVFYFVFATGIRGRGPEFAPFLMCGLVAFKWFTSSVNKAGRWEKGHGSIIQQVYVPKIVFLLMTLLNNFLKFLIILVLLAVFLALFGNYPSTYWLAMPVLLIVEFLLIFGVGTLVGSITPLVPDLSMVVENVLILMFFLSGIFFDINDFQEPYQTILYANPMITVIESFRDVLLRNEWPDWQSLAIIAGVSVLLGVLGVTRMLRHDRYYPRFAQ